MNKQNKAWEKPQLVILARGLPEENVLEHCKTNNDQVQTQPGKVIQTQVQDCSLGADQSCKVCQSRANAGS